MTERMGLRQLAEGLRHGGLTTEQLAEGADLCELAAGEIAIMRSQIASLERRSGGGWARGW